MKRRLAVLLTLVLLLSVHCGFANSLAENPAGDDTDAAAPAAWTCPSCGKTGNDDLFCSHCGMAKPTPVSDEEIEVNPNLYQIPGETDRVEVSILRIDGSSYIRGSKKNPYLFEPAKAVDGKETTCWQVSAKKGGKKAPWLAMIIEGETVDELWICNGNRSTNAKGKSQFPLYARLKEIRVEIHRDDGGGSDTLSFTLDDQSEGWQKLELGRHENVYDVWIYVESIYRGSSKKYNACLADLMLVQRAPAESAMPPWD